MQCHSACDFIAVSCHASLFIMISWSSASKLILSHTIVCHMAQSYDHKRFTCRAMETQGSAGVCDSKKFTLHAQTVAKLFKNNKGGIYLEWFFTANNRKENIYIKKKTDSQQAQVCQFKQFTRLIKFSQKRLKTGNVCNCGINEHWPSQQTSLYGTRNVVSVISFHSQEMTWINPITKEDLVRTVCATNLLKHAIWTCSASVLFQCVFLPINPKSNEKFIYAETFIY